MKYPTYSGTSGFYAAVLVDLDFGFRSLVALTQSVIGVNIQEEKAAEKDPDDLVGFHCTVMYSKFPLTCSPTQAAAVASRMTGPITVKVHKYEYWDGHDNEGYLVAQLVAPDLVRWHNAFADLGAKATFDDYIPHVTLLTGDKARGCKDKLLQLNASLVARGGLTMVMTGVQIFDLKD